MRGGAKAQGERKEEDGGVLVTGNAPRRRTSLSNADGFNGVGERRLGSTTTLHEDP